MCGVATGKLIDRVSHFVSWQASKLFRRIPFPLWHLVFELHLLQEWPDWFAVQIMGIYGSHQEAQVWKNGLRICFGTAIICQ